MTTPRLTGIAGVGHGHSNLYLPALMANAAARVVAVCDPDADKLARRARELGGVAAYRDPEEMFAAHPELELVFVLGEHRAMAQTAIATARRRIPFVLEKPGGLTVEDVQWVRDAVTQFDVPVAVPFVQRFGPLRRLFAEIGRPRHVALHFLAGLPQRYRDSGDGWLLDPACAGAGVILNLGVHLIDAFLHFCAADEPVQVVGSDLRSVEPGLRVDDYFCALLRSGSGTTGVLEASYTFPATATRHVGFRLQGERGFASMDQLGAAVVLCGQAEHHLTLDPDSNNYYAPFVDAVYSTFDDGFAGLPTVDDLVRVRHVTDHILGNHHPSDAGYGAGAQAGRTPR